MKYIIAGCLLLALFACAGTPEPLQEQTVEPISDRIALKAIQLYNTAEFSYQQGEIENALQFLQQAEGHDPQSATIRDRISEILLELAMDDQEYLPLLIDTLSKYYDAGYHSISVLSSLADGYFLDGQSAKGLAIFEELIEIDDSALNLYKYYLLQLQYFNVQKPELLEQALEKSWDNPRMVLILANQLKSIDPQRSENIFVEAWEKFQDEESLVELVNYYRESGKSDELIELLTGLMQEKREIDGWMRETLLRNLFIMEQHEVIIENQAWFLDSDIDLTDTRIIMFWSAKQTDNVSLLTKMCDALIDTNVLTELNRDRYLALTGTSLVEHGDIERAAGYYNKIVSPEILVTQMHEIESDSTRAIFEQTIETMQQIEPNDTLNIFLHAMIEPDGEKALPWLEKVDRDYILRNGLTKLVANAYVNADLPQMAIETIQRDSTIYEDYRLIIGLAYAMESNHERTIEFLEPLIDEKPQTIVLAYNALAAAYNLTDQHDKYIELTQNGVTNYPDDPLLLNDLAYTYAHENRELEQARVYINKALEQEQEIGAFWDTAAWVEYRLGNYDKALESIEKALALSPDSSTLSYHAGEIYHELGKHKKAKQSLKDAVLFDNDSEDVEKARKALNEYYQIILEDK